METKEIEIEGKKFTVHELLAIEFDEIQKIEDQTDRVVALIKKSANLSDEDYMTITIKERRLVTETMNELNGWSDFQKSETEEKEE